MPPPQAPQERLALRLREVCQLLGLSDKTVLRLCDTGKLPHKALLGPSGRRTLLFDPVAIRAWLAEPDAPAPPQEG